LCRHGNAEQYAEEEAAPVKTLDEEPPAKALDEEEPPVKEVDEETPAPQAE
jgi:hypothetical protein